MSRDKAEGEYQQENRRVERSKGCNRCGCYFGYSSGIGRTSSDIGGAVTTYSGSDGTSTGCPGTSCCTYRSCSCRIARRPGNTSGSGTRVSFASHSGESRARAS